MCEVFSELFLREELSASVVVSNEEQPRLCGMLPLWILSLIGFLVLNVLHLEPHTLFVNVHQLPILKVTLVGWNHLPSLQLVAL